MMSFRKNENMIKNKICIITGAGRGIGFQLVEDLLSLGNTVIAFSLTKSKKIDQLLENNPKYIENLYRYEFDITDNLKTKEIIQKIWKNFSRIDILINCVGAPYGSLFSMTPISEFKKIFDVNFFSIIYISQICARFMARNKKGVICNVSSSTSLTSDKGTLVYGSSKASLNYATKVISKELADSGIRVNAVAPGVTDTDMLKKMDTEAIKNQLKSSSLKKIASTSQIAGVILFLCSDLSSHMTGQIISVDGGI